MPIGTAVHEKTFALCESLSYREWSGYYAVSSYEIHHEHEYNAIRNAAALIDVSPLYKYRITGTRRDAARRSHRHAGPAQGRRRRRSSTRRGATSTARRSTTGPSRAWRRTSTAGRRPIRPCAGSARTRSGMRGRDRGHLRAASPRSRCRGRRPAGCSQASPRRRSSKLKYFRVTRGKIAGVPVEISRTGYTGDLGYEIWIPWDEGGTGLGRADGGREGLRHAARRGCSPSTSRGSRRGCC